MGAADPPDKGFRAFVTKFPDDVSKTCIVTVAESRDAAAQFILDNALSRRIGVTHGYIKANTWDLPFGYGTGATTLVCIGEAECNSRG